MKWGARKITSSHQIWHKVLKNIFVCYLVTKVIIFQNAASRKCYISSRNMTKAYQISKWMSCFEGLTDGVAFVVKCKKSKITWIIMNAPQFSTMHTVIDTFLGIWRKMLIEWAQYSCKWYLHSLKHSWNIGIDIVNALISINTFYVPITCQSIWNLSISSLKVALYIVVKHFLASAMCNVTLNSILDCEWNDTKWQGQS